MSKIVFVNPPISLEKRYGNFKSAGSTEPCYGLLILAAITRRDGYQTGIVEAGSLGLNYQDTIKQILIEKPDYIGITATTISIFDADKLAKKLKKEFSKIKLKTKIIIGGPHVTAVPTETFKRFKTFDIGVIGEGEETILELLNSLDKGKNLQKIKGIIFREKNKIIQTQRREFIKNLDQIPYPAWDLLEGFPEKYHPSVARVRKYPAAMLLSSRGCPNHCIFCDRSVSGSLCRTHSPEYIFGMIKILYEKYRVREILFEDDMFFIFKNRIKELCRLLIKSKINISWSCAGRVNAIDPGTLKLMKKAGCWQISYGIESGNENILKLIRKNITLEQIKRAVYMTKKAGILAKGFFIIGHPTETETTIEKTIDLALSLPLDDASFFPMTPLPGTELHRIANKYGKLDDDWQKMNLVNIVFIPFGLTKKKILYYKNLAFKRFYMRPKIWWSYLKRIKNLKVFSQLIRGGFLTLKAICKF